MTEGAFRGARERLRVLRGVRAIANHKFKVGETVEFWPGRMGLPAPRRECTIVRLLPADSGSRLYRIKCASETFERVVSEGQLTGRM